MAEVVVANVSSGSVFSGAWFWLLLLAILFIVIGVALLALVSTIWGIGLLILGFLLLIGAAIIGFMGSARPAAVPVPAPAPSTSVYYTDVVTERMVDVPVERTRIVPVEQKYTVIEKVPQKVVTRTPTYTTKGPPQVVATQSVKVRETAAVVPVAIPVQSEIIQSNIAPVVRPLSPIVNQGQGFPSSLMSTSNLPIQQVSPFQGGDSLGNLARSIGNPQPLTTGVNPIGAGSSFLSGNL